MNNETSVESVKNLNGVIKIDAAQIHSHLDTVVRTSVEETLNKLLDEEADRLCNAARYEHSDSRADMDNVMCQVRTQILLLSQLVGDIVLD